MRVNQGKKHTGHLKARVAHGMASALMLISASLMSAACGGEETESPPQTTETPASAPEEVLPVAEEQEELEVQDEPEEVVAEAAEPAGPPLIDVPDYARVPTVCEPHPENALEEPIRRRDLSRGEPDFPIVAAINATCEHDPAELAETFNEGGLRRHRQRDYVQSEYYFASAVALDPSQLSARFNLACAMARQEMIDTAIEQLRELQRGGREGIEYAARAHRDRDFGVYHGTPMLAVLWRDAPAVVEATAGRDTQLFSEQEPSSYHDMLFTVLGERVWERGALEGDEFSAFVLTLEPDRRRFRFFNDRPSDEARAALEAMGLEPMLRHAGWTPAESQNYLVVPVSSRDEDRHTLYIAKVMDEGTMQPIDSRDLPAIRCDEGVEAVRTFVETDDHRAFGYITGCLGAAPSTFERCLYYYTEGRGVLRRCGQGQAPVAEEAATEEVEGVGTAEMVTDEP